MANKFTLGQMVVTRAINDVMAENNQFAKDVAKAIEKYIKCDWGTMSEDDANMNDEAVKLNNDRIFASYSTCKGTIWIITEWDRSVTTILFPSDY